MNTTMVLKGKQVNKKQQAGKVVVGKKVAAKTSSVLRDMVHQG